jgi:hypothetical protein
MRLINADKLMEVVMTTCLNEIDILGGPVEGMSIALDRIYDAPTVNAVRMEKGGKNEQ